MQAIKTKRLEATNTKGQRVKAMSQSGKNATLPWDFSLDTAQNHFRAVYALCQKLDWHGELKAGSLHDGGYAFVFVESESTYFV